MKIGIITYHRSYNYGALLQATALREFLSERGHNVYFVDYWPAHNKHRYSVFSFTWMIKTQRGIKKKIKYVISCISNFNYRKKRNKCFQDYISEYILPYLLPVSESFDIVIHGSDQIWRKQPEIDRYNPVYFGKHDIKTKLKISYAASMGIVPQNDMEKNMLRKYVSYLDVVSVREKDLQDFLFDLGFSNIKLVVDPTLLLDCSHWTDLFKIKKTDEEPYLLYYKLQNSFDENEVRKFADAMKLKIKIISGRYRNKSENGLSAVNPKDFVEVIANSSYIFTSSFHGLVFSLLYHKPFLASFTNSSARAISLLSEIGLSTRLIKPCSIFTQVAYQKIDYDQVDINLHSLREKSIKFLMDICVSLDKHIN